MPSEEVLRGLLTAAPDALLAVDSHGDIVFVSEQAERLFGWTRQELTGQRVECLVPGRFQAGHPTLRAGYFEEAVARPMGAGLELWAQRKDGSQFPAEISLSGFPTSEGTLVAAAVRDVTDRVELEAERRRRELEAQREQAHRLESLGQLAGGVAHDFNNLLGVILNYCTLLTRQMPNDNAAADLQEIKAAAQRAASLTRQLLAFARKDVANPELLDLNEVVRNFSTLLARTLGEHVNLRLDLVDQPLTVLADGVQLEQVLLNLALNARDAMAGGGVLTIATSVSDGRLAKEPSVRLDVIDTGIGMDPEVMARAFEPFYTTKALGEGTGLGLATVYGIVRQSGGDVTIESTAGRGTKISVSLPADRRTASTVVHTEQSVPGGIERVLLVEDEEALRVATARILTDHGYEVLTAVDGVDALRLFDDLELPVDIVVTDVAMPRMRGDDLARQLIERQADLPVVFMSGYDSRGAVFLQGRLLEKPVDEHSLLHALREALDDRPG